MDCQSYLPGGDNMHFHPTHGSLGPHESAPNEISIGSSGFAGHQCAQCPLSQILEVRDAAKIKKNNHTLFRRNTHGTYMRQQHAATNRMYYSSYGNDMKAVPGRIIRHKLHEL